jgi:tyrosine-protein kinase Etk/Wzc
LLNVIDKFNLIEYYDFSKYKRERTLKAFREDAKFDLTQNGLIEISTIHESPDTARLIVDYFILALDSLNKEFTSAHATSYRKFIERRYLKNLEDMRIAENEFKSFQKKYKVYSIPEQLEVAFQVIAGFEGELAKKELEAEIIKISQGENSPNLKIAQEEVEILKKKLNLITSGKSTTDESVIYFSFKDIPEIQVEYLRLYREIEIQNKLLEFTLPIYEQAVMEEMKDIPTIVVLDPPLTPELKESPKKAFIILSVGFLFLFIHMFYVYRAEYILKKNTDLNIVERKEYNLYSMTQKIYKI